MARFITRFAVRRAPWALLVAFLLLGLALTGLRSVEATTFTWTHLSSGNASGSWNTSGNWNSGVGPIASGADNTADFSTLNITADSTVTLDGNQTIGNLIFGDTNTGSAANWIVNTGTSGTLTLATSSGSPTITTNTVTATLNNVIAGSAGLTKQGTGTLILNGGNTYTGGTTISGGVLQIGGFFSTGLGSGPVTNNASLVFTPQFSNNTLVVGNTISGGGTVTVTQAISGSAVTNLTASNSYSGITTISSGALQANDGVGLPTGSFLNLNGGVLMATGTASFTRSLGTGGSGNFQWNTGGGGFAASGGQLTVNIGGAGAELVWGTAVGSQIVGPLVLGNGVANGKTLFVNGIDLNNTASAATRTIVAGGGTLAPEISGIIRNSNAVGGLTISGTGDASFGTIILSGANTYTGTTTLSGSTHPVLRATEGVGLPTASFLSLDGGILETNGTSSFTRSLATSGSGKFQWTSSGGGFAAKGGQLTVNIGGAGGELVWGATVGSQIVGTLVFGAPDSDAKVLFVNGIDLNNTASPATRIISAGSNSTGSPAGEISGVIRNSNAAGALAILNSSLGNTLILSAANTYTGTTTLFGGALRANDGAGLPTASFLSLSGGVLEGSGTSSFTRSLGTSGGGKFQWTSSLFGSGFAANGGQLTVNIGGAAGEVVWGTTVGSQIVDQLRFGTGDANAKTLFVNGIDLNNTVSAATRTINLTGGAGSDSTEISGVIRNSNAAGALAISQVGGGSPTLILSGANTYTGSTTIGNSVQLQIGNGGTAGSLGSGPVGVGSVGSLIFNRSNSITVGNAISGGGALTQAGTGTTILTGANTYSGSTTISSGILQIGNGGTTGTLGSSSITDNASLVFNRSDSITVANSISGTGSVTQAGAGTTILTSFSNSYGATIISAGVLQVGNGGFFNGTIGTGPVTDNASLVFNLSDSVTVGNAITGTGSVTQAGTDAIILTGTNSYDATLISAGTLQVGDFGTTGTLGTGAVTDNASLVFARSNAMTVGNAIGGSGTLTQDGDGTTTLTGTNSYAGNTTINNGTLQIGNGGTTGTLGTGAVSNNFGTLVFNRSNSMTVSNVISGFGAVIQAGTGTTILTAANSYSGTTTISAGALQANNGTGLPSARFLKLDGGVLQGNGTASFTRSIGSSGSTFQWTAGGGGFSANGGQMTVNVGGAGAEVTWGSTVGSQIVGTLQFGSPTANAKTLFVNGINLNSTATTGLTRTINVTGGTGGDSAEISGVIRNTGAATNLTKTGSGTLILTNANTYSGDTNINGGTLEADNATSSTGTGTVRVNADGTLSGVGKVTGNVIVDGTASDHQATLSPGHSVGTLAIAGSLTFESDGKLFYEIDSSAPATPAADLVTVTGNVTINSGAKLQISDPAALSIFPKKLTLISYTGLLTGTFDGHPNLSQFSFGGTTYQINYFDAGMGVNGGLGTGSYVTLSAVPEASVALFGTLVCVVIGIRRGARKLRQRAIA